MVKFWANEGSSLLIRKLSYLSVPLVGNLLRLMQAYSYLVVFKLVTVILKKRQGTDTLNFLFTS